jgi:hypothetical protein
VGGSGNGRSGGGLAVARLGGLLGFGAWVEVRPLYYVVVSAVGKQGGYAEW